MDVEGYKNFKPMHDRHLWPLRRRGFLIYCVTPAMTQGLGIYYLIRRTVPSYDKQDKQKRYLNLFQPESLLRKQGNDKGLWFYTYTYRIPLKLREEIQNSSQIDGRNSEFLSN